MTLRFQVDAYAEFAGCDLFLAQQAATAVLRAPEEGVVVVTAKEQDLDTGGAVLPGRRALGAGDATAGRGRLGYV